MSIASSSTGLQGDSYCGAGKVNEITWTATDDCGFTNSNSQTITVRDTLAPVLSNIPVTQNFLCTDANLDPAYTGGLPTAADVCYTSTITPTYTDIAIPHPIHPGVQYTRTFTAMDDCTNTATATQTINVVDDCEFEISQEFSGVSVTTTVSIQNIEGGVEINVEVTDPDLTADLRGIFFQVANLDAGNYPTIQGSVPNGFCDVNGIDRIAKDVLMKGGGNNMPVYQCAVEIGTPGMAKGDYQTATFQVIGTDSMGNTISTDNFPDGSYFAIRSTSVGVSDGNREESSKTYGPATCCRSRA